jgi:predicted transcriptional regulator
MGKQRKYVPVGVTLRRDQAHRLQILAAVQGRNRSAVFRDVVDAYLSDELADVASKMLELEEEPSYAEA